MVEDLVYDLKDMFNALYVNPDQAPEWLVRNIVRSVKEGMDKTLGRVEGFMKGGGRHHG